MLFSLLQALLFPPGLLLPGLACAALAASRRRPRFARMLVVAPVLATLVFSLPIVADLVAGPIEQRAREDSGTAPSRLPRRAVVLGGAIGNSSVDAGYDLFGPADRVVAAAQLWRTGQVDLLILSGGSDNAISEAELMARFAEDLGVPRSAMLLETESRTTRENARGVARVLRANQLETSVALVTSSLHLPRAMVEFRCAGLAPVAVPAEYESLGAVHHFPEDWLPSAMALDGSRRALKEWVGRFTTHC